MGSPAYTAGRANPVAIAGDERERDDLARRDREREQDEDDQTDDVRADEQPLPRKAVDQRTEQEPDCDRRQEIGDQQRRHPLARVGPVLDVDGERDDREERPEPRDQIGGEEEPEARRRAEHLPLASEEGRHGARP